MATDGVVKHYLTFVGGLSTEASPLSFPPDTAKDLDNVDLQRNGTLKRRLSLELENDGAFSEEDFINGQISEQAIKTYEWRSVAGDGNLNFLVMQIGPSLYFHDLDEDSVSQHPIGVLNFAPTAIDDSFAWYPVDMSQGRGALFVVGRFIEPFYIKYDSTLDQFDGFALTIKIRDIDGLDERNDPSAVITTGEETPDAPTDTDFDFDFDYLDLIPPEGFPF